jgi:hypothetical protein
MKRLAFVIPMLGLLGCKGETEPVYSPDVSTLDLDVSVYAKDEGQGASIEVAVTSPLGSLRFSGGDELRLSMAGAPLDLRDGKNEYGGPIYLGEATSLSDDLILDIVRPADRSVMGFVVPVPPPIHLKTEPILGTGPLVFFWDAAPGAEHDLSLRVEGVCIESLQRALPSDVGSYKIINAELLPAEPMQPSMCPLTVTLVRAQVTQGKLVPEAPLYQFYGDVTVSESAIVDWSP